MPPAVGNSRSRNNNRRKADDDSAYIGASGLGRKRTATSVAGEGKLDVGTDRTKRKRVGASQQQIAMPNYSTNTATGPMNLMIRKSDVNDTRPIYMDFAALPPASLHRYLVTWNLVPPMDMLSSTVPALPSSIMIAQARAVTPESTTTAVGVTPANRPRREHKDGSKRRSSRLVEDEMTENVAVMADVEASHHAYALIAERHFQQKPAAKEVEVLTNFLHAVGRSRGPETLSGIQAR